MVPGARLAPYSVACQKWPCRLRTCFGERLDFPVPASPLHSILWVFFFHALYSWAEISPLS